MPTPRQIEAIARDVLLVDEDAGVREGLSVLLREAGAEVTAVGTFDRARDQLTNRFFAVLVVDLDGPSAQAGLTLVGFARERSPQTAVIVLSSRRTFEALAAAFRAGAFDVIPKTHDSLPYLRARVVEAMGNLRTARTSARLMAELAELHEGFLAQMVALFRQVTDLEERLIAARNEADHPVPPQPPVDLLVVDLDVGVCGPLREVCGSANGWNLRLAETGGAALDESSQRPPHVLLVNEELSDLPVSMLAKAVRTAAPDAVIVHFRDPRPGRPGELSVWDTSRGTRGPRRSFATAAQLLDLLDEFRDTVRQRAREKRQMAAFRKQHADFLRQYGDIRQKLAEEL